MPTFVRILLVACFTAAVSAAPSKRAERCDALARTGAADAVAELAAVPGDPDRGVPGAPRGRSRGPAQR